jgi:hypothetical protein
MPKAGMIKTSYLLPEDLYWEFQEAAAARRMNGTEAVRTAFREFIENTQAFSGGGAESELKPVSKSPPPPRESEIAAEINKSGRFPQNHSQIPPAEVEHFPDRLPVSIETIAGSSTPASREAVLAKLENWAARAEYAAPPAATRIHEKRQDPADAPSDAAAAARRERRLNQALEDPDGDLGEADRDLEETKTLSARAEEAFEVLRRHRRGTLTQRRGA